MVNGAARAGRARTLSIVLGLGVGVGLSLAALALVALVVPHLMRSPVAQKADAALPALASPPSPPPLVEAADNARILPTEPEPLFIPKPPPIQIGPREASLGPAPPARSAPVTPPWVVPLPPPREAAADLAAPLPPARPPELAPAPAPAPAAGYDRWTAIYDISAHTVYMPSGIRLEAHSGLAESRDDPRFVNEHDRGATPPHLYDLTLRESLFHGVQALRLTPIGDGFVFDRVGLLAHPYMLGPNGDSNGCVSFRDYDAFLRAFQNGEVKRLAVVARLTQDPAQFGRFAILRQGPNR